MGFNVNNQAVLPISHVADKAQGRYAEAERFQEQDTDIAAMLTDLRQGLTALAGSPPFDPSLYYTKSQNDAALLAKQGALGFVPIDSLTVGQPSGVVPLNSSGQIDAQYLVPASAGGVTGVTSFNGNVGAVTLTSADVSNALGFAPASVSHTQPMATITGLQTALTGKQDALGFTPANVNHTHVPADIIGLGEYASFSTSAVANETNFPIGSLVLALDSNGPISVQFDDGTGNGTFITKYVNPRRWSRTIYAPILESGAVGTNGVVGETAAYYYTTTATGSALTGSWRSCGYGGSNLYLFQRTS